MTDKTLLRKQLLATRSALSADEKMRRDHALCARVVAWSRRSLVATLGVYWPIRNEPDLRDCYAILAGLGVQLALPLVIGRELPLQFAAWQPGQALDKDAMGIAIPAAPRRLVQPDAVLIPCVGFNAARLRLGYGGGFYDRTLAMHPRPLAVGIAYADAQAEFDGAAHDIALDLILTDGPDEAGLPSAP